MSETEWKDLIHKYWEQNQALVNRSKFLKDKSHHVINEIENTIAHKSKQTKTSLQFRQHEYDLTLESLNDQRAAMEREIQRMLIDLEEVDKKIDNLAEDEMITISRLENRNFRLGSALMRDRAGILQKRSLQHVNTSRDELRRQQKLNRETLNNLELQLGRLIEEIDLKKKSKKLDEQILDIIEKISFEKDYPTINSLIGLV